MFVISSREFRANQKKYFDLAHTNDVIIKSRNHGSYRLVPIRENDTIFDEKALDEKIRQSIKDYENGNVFRMKEDESVSDFVDRLITAE